MRKQRDIRNPFSLRKKYHSMWRQVKLQFSEPCRYLPSLLSMVFFFPTNIFICNIWRMSLDLYFCCWGIRYVTFWQSNYNFSVPAKNIPHFIKTSLNHHSTFNNFHILCRYTGIREEFKSSKSMDALIFQFILEKNTILGFRFAIMVLSPWNLKYTCLLLKVRFPRLSFGIWG